MSVLPVGIGSSGGYEIANSLRFRASNSAYLSRTPGVAGNRRTWTWSGWVKRGVLVGDQVLFSAYADASNFNTIRFSDTTNALRFYWVTGGAAASTIDSAATYRDPSAHLHIHVSVDTTQATASNRVKISINGEQLNSFSTANYPALNSDMELNRTVGHNIGRFGSGSQYFDGYLSEINFIDGQALTPTSFGETNSDGVWVPKKYTGTYGTNGFYLPFNDGTSATTLGYDRSGNSNNWTPSGISTTAGVTYDWMDDTCTNSVSSAQPVGNYATLNPLDKAATGITLSNGNLTISTSAVNKGVRSTIAQSSGKWYFEAKLTTKTGNPSVGIGTSAWALDYVGSGNGVGYHATGDKYTNGTPVSAWGATYTTGDIIGIALDMDGGSITFYKNNTSQGVAATGLSGEYFAAISGQTSDVWDINFGQRPFAYTPPTGFKALCTANRQLGGSITTSGTFTGNLSTNGPFVWLNGNPSTMTINGNAVTWGTHAIKTAGGFKVISSSSSYNASGSNTYSVTVTGELFGDVAHSPNTAQGNP